MTQPAQTKFGRADADGNVYLIADGTERFVGQYQGATAEQALAFFERKFADLESQVKLLEQRARTGAKANSLQTSAQKLLTSLPEAAVVGDIAALKARLEKFVVKVDSLSQEQAAAKAKALADREKSAEAIVVKMEELAAKSQNNPNWKQGGAELTTILNEWKAVQSAEPRMPKKTADGYWDSIRQFRNVFERNRRAFFTKLDSDHKLAKATKQKIIEQAKLIDVNGDNATLTYRGLLDEWKAAGRAGGKADDALWAEFKAAGDAIYAVKNAQRAASDAEQQENLKQKEALLVEAEALLPVDDIEAFETKLRKIEDAWEQIGYVPRADVQRVESRLSKVAKALKDAKDKEWKSNDPELEQRSNSMLTQLKDAIAGLESDLATAQASGDQKRIKEAQEALDARKAWLKAVSH